MRPAKNACWSFEAGDTALSLATIMDLDAVSVLLRAQFAEHALTLGEARFRAAVESLLDNPARGVVILAIEAGRAVGLALLVHAWTVELGGPGAWLEELYVVPERREGGIGSKLLQRAIEVARQRHCLAIDLEVDSGHGRAANLYQRAGFRPLARTRWTLPLTLLGDAVTVFA